MYVCFFFFSSRRRHTRCGRDWSSDVCSSDLKNGMLAHAACGPKGAERLRQRECGRLRDRVGRTEWHGSQGRQRQKVDDGSTRLNQQRKECLRHAVCPEEVDREVSFDPCPITQVIVKVNSGAIDKDIERFDVLGSCANLLWTGHVQHQGRYTFVRTLQGSGTCCRIYLLCTPPESLTEEGPTDTAVGAGNHDCLVL